MTPTVTLIAAVARNGVIGKDGALPWHLPADLKRFKAITMGHPIIMGRKTWDSLGRPLPGRLNIVVSRSGSLHAEGALVVRSLAAALESARNADQVFVIGGAQIYAESLPLARRLLLTEIDADFDGDVRFPTLDRSAWHETQREAHAANGGPAYAFVTWEKTC